MVLVINMKNINDRDSLNIVHQLIREEKIAEAIVILERLVNRHPDFLLYSEKLSEFKRLLRPSDDNEVVIQNPTSTNLNQNNEDMFEPNVDVNYWLDMAVSGEIYSARKILTEPFNQNPKSATNLVALAKIDIIELRYIDALKKAEAAIANDSLNRDAYRIAERASIELGKFKEANEYFLSQPPVSYPKEPRQRLANPALPPQFKLQPIIGAGNDYRHILERAMQFSGGKKEFKKTVSIIIPVYNRSYILANTLAAITYQSYPHELIEVIVIDDGSSDDVPAVIRKYENKLNLYYCRQSDKGYRLSAARNIGLRQAKGDALIFLDADILPLPEDIEKYMTVSHVSDDCVLIGHRRYVDTSKIDDDMILSDISVVLNLPTISTNNDVADCKASSGESIDWRFQIYKKTENLINDQWPFTKAAGGNIAFSRKLFNRAGFVDEEFIDWGCEDGEHGYRLYNSGAYFIPMLNIVSLHQEPQYQTAINSEEHSFRKRGHAITKKIFSRKCPAPVVRKYIPGEKFDIPKVSIYIPAYNAGNHIYDAVQSCLEQDFLDLEVCICDDGSTDNTVEILQKFYGDNSQVRWISQVNGGIGMATNKAINLCRGMYIAQLDADDILKPHAVRKCVEVLDSNINVDAVYGDCDYIDIDGKYIRDGWCGGNFSREWMATEMIATHFRMFRKRLWSRTTGCNERMKNAVDLDLWLKFFECGNIEHIHQILYSYRWHGLNTSIQYRKIQEHNHLIAVSDSLKRQYLDRFWMVQPTGNKLNPRDFKIIPQENPQQVRPEDVIFIIPTCKKNYAKAEAIRRTWASGLEGLGYRYYFLIGNPDLSESKLSGDVLYVPCRDDYESLLIKLVLGYEFIYRTISFTHIYKIDDDCYLDIIRLTEDILPQLAQAQYAGGAVHPKGNQMNNMWHFGKCSDTRFDKPHIRSIAIFDFAKGGYGYFLRRDIVPIIIEQLDCFIAELEDFKYSFEDVRISEVLGNHLIFASKLSKYDVSKAEQVSSSFPLLIYDIKNSMIFDKYHKFQ